MRGRPVPELVEGPAIPASPRNDKQKTPPDIRRGFSVTPTGRIRLILLHNTNKSIIFVSIELYSICVFAIHSKN